MELIKYIIEYDGRVVINNELTVDIQKNQPLVIEWFKNNEIITNPESDKIIINENTFILRPRRENAEKQEAPRQTIEKLNTVLGHVRITTEKESYIALKEKNNPTTTELPFAFLQCVQYGDFENARAMLAFDISDSQLKDYFGEFTVLINNYLSDESLFSILPVNTTTARTFTFQIKDNKIINIS